MRKIAFRLFILIFTISFVSTAAAKGVIKSDLKQMLSYSQQADLVNIIIDFSDTVNFKTTKHKGKHNRSNLIREAKNKSSVSQKKVIQFLTSKNITNYKKLWLINAIAVTVETQMVAEIVAFVGVSRIRYDKQVTINSHIAAAPGIPELNIDQVNTPAVWDLGFTGQGVVIGLIGTGVDVNHPDLKSRYRGGSNSWRDIINNTTTPYDILTFHGTAAMSVALGGNSSGINIGIAPGAHWIAAKIFDDSGTASFSAMHDAFQWMLDPDNDSMTDDAADVINASWSVGTSNSCVLEFQTDIIALNNAGISIVFSSGNISTPKSNSSFSPANNLNSISVGSVDETLSLTNFSGRGPAPASTPCASSGIYPKLVAPGTNIFTADKSFGGTSPNPYTTRTGTSFSAPHVVGALALLQSALPDSDPRNTAVLREEALRLSAIDLGASGDDNQFGWGLLNISGAYQMLLAGNTVITLQPDANTDFITLKQNSTATKIDVLSNDTVDIRIDSTNSINPKTVVATDPNNGSVTVNPDTGVVSYTPTPGFNGSDSFQYTVDDILGNTSNSGRVTITVTQVAAAGSSGGGGCSLKSHSSFDPVLVLLLVLSFLYLLRNNQKNREQF